MSQLITSSEADLRSDTRALMSVAHDAFSAWNDQSTQRFRDQLFTPLMQDVDRFQRELETFSEVVEASRRRLSD